MSSAFPHRVFDEPDAVDPGQKPKRFKVAPTAIIDFSFTALNVAGILPACRTAVKTAPLAAAAVVVIWLFAIFACYFAKTRTVGWLGAKGGDARTYVKSGALVVTGPYAWSRHPTYALAMLQFLLWAGLGLFVQAFVPAGPLLWVAVIGGPLGFYLINDLVVMPSEEAFLRKLYPEEFDAYAARVNRWFGRRAG